MTNVEGYEPIRLEAKEYGIAQWHLKGLEKLETELNELKADMESNTPRADKPGMVSKISYGQLLDILDELAVERLMDSFEALDTLSHLTVNHIVTALDTIFTQHPVLGSSVKVEWLYQRCRLTCKGGCHRSSFDRVMTAVCKLYGSRGWKIDEVSGVLSKPTTPMFNLKWHVDLWKSGGEDRSTAYRILTVLSANDTETE